MKVLKIGGPSGLIIGKGDWERGAKECGKVETSSETRRSEILAVTVLAETCDHRLLLGGVTNFVKVKPHFANLTQTGWACDTEGDLNTKCYRRLSAFIGDLALILWGNETKHT